MTVLDLETVKLDIDGAVARVTLNRPEALNAWTRQLGEDMLSALDRAAEDAAVRAIVLTGEGRAFSSGADLKAGSEFGANGSPDVLTRLRTTYNPLLLMVRTVTKPVIAAVNGPAVGIGCSLALAATGSPVTLVHRSPHLTARRDLVERVRTDGRITEMAGWNLDKLVGSDRLQGIDVSDSSTGEHRRLDVRGVVLKLGRAQRVDLVREQLKLGVRGGIAVDAELRTSDPRTFAAGDVVEGAYERIATAVGQGSLAARTIVTYLKSSP